MATVVTELAPRCARCRSRHLPTLRCWRGRYAQDMTRHVLTTQGRVCWLCGRPGADSADHVTPRSHGGTDDPNNLRPAHTSPCNSRRGNRHPFPTTTPEPAPAALGLSTRWDPR